MITVALSLLDERRSIFFVSIRSLCANCKHEATSYCTSWWRQNQLADAKARLLARRFHDVDGFAVTLIMS